jgi:hypothetical protein
VTGSLVVALGVAAAPRATPDAAGQRAIAAIVAPIVEKAARGVTCTRGFDEGHARGGR